MKTSSKQFATNHRRQAQVRAAAVAVIRIVLIRIPVNRIAAAAVQVRAVCENRVEITKRSVHINATPILMTVVRSRAVRLVHRQHRQGMVQNVQNIIENQHKNQRKCQTIGKKPIPNQFSILKQSNRML